MSMGEWVEIYQLAVHNGLSAADAKALIEAEIERRRKEANASG